MNGVGGTEKLSWNLVNGGLKITLCPRMLFLFYLSLSRLCLFTCSLFFFVCLSVLVKTLCSFYLSFIHLFIFHLSVCISVHVSPVCVFAVPPPPKPPHVFFSSSACLCFLMFILPISYVHLLFLPLFLGASVHLASVHPTPVLVSIF